MKTKKDFQKLSAISLIKFSVSGNKSASQNWIDSKVFRYILLVLFWLLLYFPLAAQWETLTSGKQFPASYDVIASVDEQTIIIGGSSGFMKSTDGGSNWTEINAGLPLGLFTPTGLQCIDAQTYFCRMGDLYKTGDGGQSWTLVNGNSGNQFQFVNAEVGFCLKPHALQKTTDGGNTWTEFVPEGIPYSLADYAYRFHFLTAESGIISLKRGSNNSVEIYKTNDGGLHWAKKHEIIQADPAYAYRKIQMLTEQLAFAVTLRGEVLKTVDGGENWQFQAPIDATASGIYDVVFIDEMHGFASGTGYIYHTTDGAKTWVKEATPLAGTAWVKLAVANIHALFACGPADILGNTNLNTEMSFSQH